jgi:hypothetical protein
MPGGIAHIFGSDANIERELDEIENCSTEGAVNHAECESAENDLHSCEDNSNDEEDGEADSDLARYMPGGSWWNNGHCACANSSNSHPSEHESESGRPPFSHHQTIRKPQDAGITHAEFEALFGDIESSESDGIEKSRGKGQAIPSRVAIARNSHCA